MQNKHILFEAFPFHRGDVLFTCALTITERGQVADPGLLRKCRARIRDREGAFSPLRGNLLLPICLEMAFSSPEPYVEKK